MSVDTYRLEIPAVLVDLSKSYDMRLSHRTCFYYEKHVSYVAVDKEAALLCAAAYTSFKINAVTNQKE
jgi:ribosomal protein L32